MSVIITLHVFSGNIDPKWELTEDEAKQLSDRLRDFSENTFLKPPGFIGMLGYRGFSIESNREKAFDEHMYVHFGILDLNRFQMNRKINSSGFEKWLLSTGEKIVSESVKKHVLAELDDFENNKEKKISHFSLLAVPPFDPGKWNNDPFIRTHNNCYNYANDKITNTFAQPGKGSGTSGPYPPDCTGTGSAAQRDGQISVSSASSTPAQGHFIGLVIWPGTDYHWYRLDNNAKWSHKPGQTPAKNIDESGSLITDPKTCNRGPYTIWCGYYHCIPANTRIQ